MCSLANNQLLDTVKLRWYHRRRNRVSFWTTTQIVYGVIFISATFLSR